MDATASIITIVHSVFTAVIRLKSLINGTHEEDVERLKKRAERLAFIIQAAQNAYGAQVGLPYDSQISPAEEDIREFLPKVISDFEQDFKGFNIKLLKLVEEGKGSFGKVWRSFKIVTLGENYVAPTFARIKEAIGHHEQSLLLLMQLHDRIVLEEIRTHFIHSFAPPEAGPVNDSRGFNSLEQNLRSLIRSFSVSSEAPTLIGKTSGEPPGGDIEDNSRTNTPSDPKQNSVVEVLNLQERQKSKPLFRAVQDRDLANLKKSISCGANIEGKNESGMTPLLLAASNGTEDIVRELLNQGADVRSRDKHQRTALHLAILAADLAILKSGHSDLVRLLLEHNPTKTITFDVNASDYEGKTPLHFCVVRNMSEAAEMLLDYGACPESRDLAKLTPFYYAIKHRKYEVTKLLVARGANFDHAGQFDQKWLSSIRSGLERSKSDELRSYRPRNKAERKNSCALSSKS